MSVECAPLVSRASVADGDVRQPAIPLVALPFSFTERCGYCPMKHSNKSDFRSICQKVWRSTLPARREEGSTIFEFGMAALVLSTLFVGIVYGGIMAYDRVVLTNAVASGTRTLASERGDPTACTDATNAVTAAAYGLNTSQLTVVTPPVFISSTGAGAGTSSCDVTTGTGPNGANCTVAAPCQELVQYEYAVMAASYPCSMYFPHLGINLCPLSQGSTAFNYPSGQNTTNISVNCPYKFCIYSIEATKIE